MCPIDFIIYVFFLNLLCLLESLSLGLFYYSDDLIDYLNTSLIASRDQPY